MKKLKRTMNIFVIVVLVLLCFMMPKIASAVPELQIYIDGATYDTASETWVLTTSGDFTLWVLGDVEKFGTIYDVKLAAAVSTAEATAGGSIALTPTTATGAGFTDPSTPGAPIFEGLSADGAIPVMGDGSSLAPHGIYGTGTSFFEWILGDFTLTDSDIGDFINSYPVEFPDKGEIKAYTVASSGFSTIHFDAYDHILSVTEAKYKFAPFSHDGESHKVPEPGSLLLFGSGIAGLGIFGRKLYRK